MRFALLALFVVASSLWADRYPRQDSIDVLHYRFQVKLSDASDSIAGEAQVELRFLKAGVQEVGLDLTSLVEGKGMVVDSVLASGAALSYTHQNHRLTIRLPQAAAAQETRSFRVKYHGVAAAGLRIGPNQHGERTFFSHNWPDLARQWLPLVDHPYDKATSEFFIEAPVHYQVVANGLLLEETDLGNGNRLTHWKQSVPIASWLNAIAVGRFSVKYFGSSHGIVFSDWVFPQDREKGIATFEQPTRDAFEFFTNFIGPYPYEKLANVQSAGLSGGTEHASVIFYGEKSVTNAAATGLVTHEIAHQWFGDSITEKDWDDVWLSEGFATYFTLLCLEHVSGRDAFLAGLEKSRNTITEYEKKVPGLPIIHDNLDDMKRVLNPLVYQKGGWVLHMLRARMGLAKFRAAIRDYYQNYRDRSASTAEFRAVIERHAGEDLGWFFEQWLKRPGVPEIEMEWSYDASAKQAILLAKQTQSGAPYRLRVELDANGTLVPVELTERTRTLRLPLEATAVLRLKPNQNTLGTFRLTKR
jgi:aminopeptidase N